MGSIHIPPQSTRRWSGPYLGNYYGTLWKTFNIDLDRSEGAVRLSGRMRRIERDTELTDLTGSNTILRFIRTDADCTDRYWAASPEGLLKTDSNSSPSPDNDWDTDGIAGSPTTGINDMVIHGNDSRNDSGRNKLLVTLDSDISVLNDSGNNAWTASWWVTKQAQPALDTGVNHPVEYFPFRKISMIGDKNLVHTVSRPSDTQNDTVTYARLILPRDYVVNHIFTTAERAWICCYNRKFESGSVVEWDGFSQSPNAIHSVNGMGVMTGVNEGGTPVVLTSKGVFLEYTGQGFSPMIRNGQKVAFPVAEEVTNSMVNNGIFLIRPRGIVVGEDGLIYVNANQPSLESYRQSAGIWCLNPDLGRLYNKYSFSKFNDSDGSDSHVDFGQQSLSASNPGAAVSGALFWVDNSVWGRGLLAAGVLEDTTGGGTYTSGIYALSDSPHESISRGYFITQYIPSDEVEDFWDTLWVKYKTFITVGNSIIIKARGVRSLVKSGTANGPLTADIAWTSTTTFTVTLNSGDDSLQEGDEVEILSGMNNGYLAHITTISGAHEALQTITIDEAVASGAGSSYAVFDRWKKLGTISSTTEYVGNLNIGFPSSFIQLKVEMRGPAAEMEVSELVVNSNTDIYNKK